MKDKVGNKGAKMKWFWILAVIVLGLAALACDLSSAVVTMTPGVTPSGIPPTLAGMPAASTAEITGAVPTAWQMVVCADGLNVRAEPDPSALKVGGLVRGDAVQVLEWRDDWARVAVGRWVNGGYLCKG